MEKQSYAEHSDDDDELSQPQTPPAQIPVSSPLSSPVPSSVKPKSAAKSSSKANKDLENSPEPQPPPPIITTIRLDIRLGGPDNYAVDISQLAKATGQRPGTPEVIPKVAESSDSEGDKKKKKAYIPFPQMLFNAGCSVKTLVPTTTTPPIPLSTILNSLSTREHSLHKLSSRVSMSAQVKSPCSRTSTLSAPPSHCSQLFQFTQEAALKEAYLSCYSRCRQTRIS